MKIFVRNPVNLALLAGVGLLAILLKTINIDTLIVFFNGVFAGCMAGLVVAYWRLIWNSMRGTKPYDRVGQMTLGFALCWIAYTGTAWVSIYTRSAGMPPMQSNSMTAIFRAVAIAAAILQVTAPDFGLGLFHGRDRKTLWLGMVVGTVVAVGAIWAQDQAVLAEYVDPLSPIHTVLYQMTS